MTFIAHPTNKEQEKAIKAFLEALEVPYEVHPEAESWKLLIKAQA